MTIIPALRPTSRAHWKRIAELPGVDGNYPIDVWDHDEGFRCLSAVEVVTDPGQPSKGPEYHLSFSVFRPPSFQRPSRTTSAEAVWLLNEFGAEGFEEDNHVPGGVVRNFWRTVAEPLIGKECECKDTEPAIVEDKGDFVWRALP